LEELVLKIYFLDLEFICNFEIRIIISTYLFIKTIMTQLVLNVEDDKFNSFIEYLKTLNYVSFVKNDEIPQWQKDEVLKNISEIKNGTAILENWDDIRKGLVKKHNL
jgi:hypothetical protein